MGGLSDVVCDSCAQVRARAGDLVDSDGKVLVTAREWMAMRLRVVSENNFPTAAGYIQAARPT